ncbi:Uncharacterised protein [Xylophilus ampelinus]|nr:Uncharacterised protein [Xylophilus ampelinus]
MLSVPAWLSVPSTESPVTSHRLLASIFRLTGSILPVRKEPLVSVMFTVLSALALISPVSVVLSLSKAKVLPVATLSSRPPEPAVAVLLRRFSAEVPVAPLTEMRSLLPPAVVRVALFSVATMLAPDSRRTAVPVERIALAATVLPPVTAEPSPVTQIATPWPQAGPGLGPVTLTFMAPVAVTVLPLTARMPSDDGPAVATERFVALTVAPPLANTPWLSAAEVFTTVSASRMVTDEPIPRASMP